MDSRGLGSLENDDARDWVRRLTASGDLGVLAAALEAATESGGYILEKPAAEALAAAEVTAALVGRPRVTLPAEVVEWVATRAGDDAGPLVLAATLALDAVENGSELSDLRAEAGGETFEEWRKSLYQLRARLSP